MLKDIGQQLQEARVGRHLTQSALGALVGLPQAHISRIERGEIDLQWSTLAQMANALALSPVLVPSKLLPLVKSLTAERREESEENPIPLVGNLTETVEGR